MGRFTDTGGRGRRPALPSLLIGLALAALAVGGVPAAAAESGPGWGACLDCHEDEDLELTTNRGERLALAVSAGDLAASAHRGLECRECHAGIRLDEHPDGVEVESLAAYSAGAAAACRGCHDPGQLGRLPQHAPLAAAGAQPACTGCHGAHDVRPVEAWRSAGAVEYCLACHGRGASVTTASGRTLSLDVDAAALAGSVHAGHDCSDCHEGYGPGSHPGGGDATLSGDGMAASRICAACHDDKFEQASGSVHFALLRAGSREAPGCADCHDPHAVAPRDRYATLTGMPCRRCHAEIFEAYSTSMHAIGRSVEGHLDAPLCADCHRAHDVSGTERPELVRAACAGCHPGAAAAHEVWLPNASLHLGAVSCVACHAPEAERAVALRIVDGASGRTLTEDEVRDVLGTEAGRLLEPGDGGVDGLELWSALRRIGQGRAGATVAVEGRLEVPRGVDAHRLRHKSGAVRRCETCHEAGSFGVVTVRLADGEGRAQRVAAAPEILVSAASAVPIRGFYALGATRVAVLDWLLVLAVLGALTVPAVHGGARLLAARRARREGRES